MTIRARAADRPCSSSALARPREERIPPRSSVWSHPPSSSIPHHSVGGAAPAGGVPGRRAGPWAGCASPSVGTGSAAPFRYLEPARGTLFLIASRLPISTSISALNAGSCAGTLEHAADRRSRACVPGSGFPRPRVSRAPCRAVWRCDRCGIRLAWGRSLLSFPHQCGLEWGRVNAAAISTPRAGERSSTGTIRIWKPQPNEHAAGGSMACAILLPRRYRSPRATS